jgi:triacylglycerol lipase
MNEDFDNTAALELGKLVAIAYAQLKQTATPVQALLPAGYKSVATLEIVEKKLHLPFGFIAINGANAYIAIRGTVTPLEWLDDASIRQLPFHIAWGDTTTGFKSIYDQLSPTIIRAVAELYQTGAVTSLYIAGHSLGAAIALLAAADILIQLRVPAVSYTFAGPRCGDPELADAFTKAQLKVWRIFNTEDIVPTLPFAAADFPGGWFGAARLGHPVLVIDKKTTRQVKGVVGDIGPRSKIGEASMWLAASIVGEKIYVLNDPDRDKFSSPRDGGTSEKRFRYIIFTALAPLTWPRSLAQIEAAVSGSLANLSHDQLVTLTT